MLVCMQVYIVESVLLPPVDCLLVCRKTNCCFRELHAYTNCWSKQEASNVKEGSFSFICSVLFCLICKDNKLTQHIGKCSHLQIGCNKLNCKQSKGKLNCTQPFVHLSNNKLTVHDLLHSLVTTSLTVYNIQPSSNQINFTQRISNSGPIANTNIFMIYILTKYEYQIYSYQ